MTQQQSETAEIQGHRFEVAKLPPLDAQDVAIDILQAIGPAIGGIAAGMARATGKDDIDSVLDIDIEDPKLGTAIAQLLSALDKRKLRELVDKMMSVTRCDDLPLKQHFIVTFRGNLPLMYQWLWFALKVNFGDFFAWGQDAIGGALAKTKESQSRNTSDESGQ